MPAAPTASSRSHLIWPICCYRWSKPPRNVARPRRSPLAQADQVSLLTGGHPDLVARRDHHVDFRTHAEVGQIDARLDREGGARAQQAGVVCFEVVDVHAVAVRTKPADRVTSAMRERQPVAGLLDHTA